MKIEVDWFGAFELRDGSRLGMIYDLPAIDAVPEASGVYVIARVHGKVVIPLYIGRALSLRQRLVQQLNNVRLMQGIWHAPRGFRTVYTGIIVSKLGSRSDKVLKTVESALIATAMAEGYDLLNIAGTKTLVHTISSTGNREARRWLPDSDIKLRRGA